MRNIILCDTCQGSGELFQRAVYRDMDDELSKCSKCNGTGRIIRFTVQIDLPHDSLNDLIQIERELLEIHGKYQQKCQEK